RQQSQLSELPTHKLRLALIDKFCWFNCNVTLRSAQRGRTKSPNFEHEFKIETTAGTNDDLLFLSSTFIAGRDIYDSIRIYVECNLYLRNASRSGRDSNLQSTTADNKPNLPTGIHRESKVGDLKELHKGLARLLRDPSDLKYKAKFVKSLRGRVLVLFLGKQWAMFETRMEEWKPYMRVFALCKEWMLNRRLLQTDYPKRLASVRNKLEQLISADLSVLDLSEHEAPSYLQALQVSQIMGKSDTRRDFFGRASQPVRSWKDIVETYEKHNLHIAEISEKVQEIAAEQVPRCRFTISDRQKLITVSRFVNMGFASKDLRQKVKEQTLNVMKKEEALEKSCKEFGINASEANIKLRLLEESTDVPTLLTNFVESLSDLTCVVDLYAAMKECTHRAFQDEQAQRVNPLPECCPTLRLLIKSGHVHLFTWKMGCEPGKLGADDDFIPALLAEERRRVQQPTVNIVQQTAVDETPVLDLDTSVDIEWGDIDRAEIDFDVIEVEEDAVAQIELDEPVQARNTNIDTNITEGNLHEAVVSGHMARFLLDTIEGRAALLNELVELSSFLTRFTDDLIESQGLNRDDLELADSPTVSTSSVGNFGGSNTIHNMIMQNSPSIIQSVSAKEAAKMLTKVERARAQLTNSSISQLLMIRSKPGYLDRLVGRLTDLRLQVERAKARVAEAQSRIDEATAEQEIQAGALVRYRSRCKQLVQIVSQPRVCVHPFPFITCMHTSGYDENDVVDVKYTTSFSSFGIRLF
ncbi:hypothetical protein X801_02682, partial [Opisthorchis viverrini]